MSKIEVGTFSSLLRRFLLMKGASDVASELAPEISPVFALESDRPEWEFLKGARLMAHATTSPAGVGVNSGMRWRNPVGSGVLAIVTKLAAGPGLNPAPANSVVNVTFGAQTADLATVSGNIPRDGRNIPPSGGAVICSFGTTAVGGTQLDIGVALTTGTSWLPLFNFPASAVVIPPGFALNVSLSNVNLELLASAHWLEKRLDDLEAR